MIAPDDFIYIVTDGEFDGPNPGQHSMLAFASVAIGADGKTYGEFEANLERLPGATTDAATDAFWTTVPQAYAASTKNPQPPQDVMRHFVDWVRALPKPAIFVSHPAALDGPWIDFYLQKYTGERLFDRLPSRLFHGVPMCLMSFAAGKLGWPIIDCLPKNYPPEWLGSHEHTHRAIDDARGYAHFFGYLMKQTAG